MIDLFFRNNNGSYYINKYMEKKRRHNHQLVVLLIDKPKPNFILVLYVFLMIYLTIHFLVITLSCLSTLSSKQILQCPFYFDLMLLQRVHYQPIQTKLSSGGDSSIFAMQSNDAPFYTTSRYIKIAVACLFLVII